MFARLAAVLGVFALVACGGTETVSGPPDDSTQVAFAIEGEHNDGGPVLSVLICGEKVENHQCPAGDTQCTQDSYPRPNHDTEFCFDDLDWGNWHFGNGPDSADTTTEILDDCTCVRLNEADLTQKFFGNLCPGDWHFTYAIYEGDYCAHPAPEWECQNRDFFPNDYHVGNISEELFAGEVLYNDIICYNQNAGKEFDIGLCTELVTDADCDLQVSGLDCPPPEFPEREFACDCSDPRLVWDCGYGVGTAETAHQHTESCPHHYDCFCEYYDNDNCDVEVDFWDGYHHEPYCLVTCNEEENDD